MATASISAAAITGLAARVTLTLSGMPEGSTMTVSRLEGTAQYPILGARDVPALSTVFDDVEVGLNTPARWRVDLPAGVEGRRNLAPTTRGALTAEGTVTATTTTIATRFGSLPVRRATQAGSAGYSLATGRVSGLPVGATLAVGALLWTSPGQRVRLNLLTFDASGSYVEDRHLGAWTSHASDGLGTWVSATYTLASGEAQATLRVVAEGAAVGQWAQATALIMEIRPTPIPAGEWFDYSYSPSSAVPSATGTPNASASILSVRSLTTPPLTITHDWCVLSDPYSGQSADVVIADMGDRTHSQRGKALDIEETPEPVYVYDVESAARFSLTLLTLSREMTEALGGIMAAGGPLLLRAACQTHRVGWFVRDGGSRVSAPLSKAATETRSKHDLSTVVATSAPRPDDRPTGDTLGDLAEVVPTTLTAISATWTTLAAIAATDMRGL